MTGKQLVTSSVSYALAENEYDLVLLGHSPARAGIGNELANRIFGNELGNGLLGHGSDDVIRGRAGNDLVSGGRGNDTAFGGTGADRLVGDDGNDCLLGGTGDDVLFGGVPTNFSAIVTALTTAGGVGAWLEDPQFGLMSAMVRFASDLPADVVFGIDQEFLESGPDPIRYMGADWMAMAGINRAGELSVRIGSEDELNGKPATESHWESFDLGLELQPDTWYRLSSVVDFASLHWISFTISGPGIEKTVDLADLPVSFTEVLPSDVRALTYFPWAARSPQAADHAPGLPVVQFDDVKGGFRLDSADRLPIEAGFEDQTEIGDQPPSDLILEISRYTEGRWYLERGGASAWIEASGAAHGDRSLASVLAIGDIDEITGEDRDVLDGGDGKDTLFGGGSDDRLIGGRGNDSLNGEDGRDRLIGGPGDDVLDGGLDADRLVGGDGDDLYIIGEFDAEDRIVERPGGGDDRIVAFRTMTLPAEVEKLLIQPLQGRIDATGNNLDNAIFGNEAANRLWGRGGDDQLDGAEGDDTLRGGTGDDTLTGGAGRDRLLGAAGNDWLEGGPGVDRLLGGDGDDFYIVDETGDRVVERAGAGTDTVVALVGLDLADNVEVLVLKDGAAPLHGRGNAMSNYLLGNDGANRLNGRGGNDEISGGSGDDLLIGGRGDDLLRGEAGSDVLRGGHGHDLYSFDVEDEVDEVIDFEGVGDRTGDLIDLTQLGTEGLRFIGAEAFTGARQVRVQADGDDTRIQVNLWGTRSPELDIIVKDGAALPSQWDSIDFLL
ncbi:MAG: calcium-binding protein [Geminicoccaceae bacterium]